MGFSNDGKVSFTDVSFPCLHHISIMSKPSDWHLLVQIDIKSETRKLI